MLLLIKIVTTAGKIEKWRRILDEDICVHYPYRMYSFFLTIVLLVATQSSFASTCRYLPGLSATHTFHSNLYFFMDSRANYLIQEIPWNSFPQRPEGMKPPVVLAKGVLNLTQFNIPLKAEIVNVENKDPKVILLDFNQCHFWKPDVPILGIVKVGIQKATLYKIQDIFNVKEQEHIRNYTKNHLQTSITDELSDWILSVHLDQDYQDPSIFISSIDGQVKRILLKTEHIETLQESQLKTYAHKTDDHNTRFILEAALRQNQSWAKQSECGCKESDTPYQRSVQRDLLSVITSPSIQNGKCSSKPTTDLQALKSLQTIVEVWEKEMIESKSMTWASVSQEMFSIFVHRKLLPPNLQKQIDLAIQKTGKIPENPGRLRYL